MIHDTPQFPSFIPSDRVFRSVIMVKNSIWGHPPLSHQNRSVEFASVDIRQPVKTEIFTLKDRWIERSLPRSLHYTTWDPKHITSRSSYFYPSAIERAYYNGKRTYSASGLCLEHNSAYPLMIAVGLGHLARSPACSCMYVHISMADPPFAIQMSM